MFRKTKSKKIPDFRKKRLRKSGLKSLKSSPVYIFRPNLMNFGYCVHLAKKLEGNSVFVFMYYCALLSTFRAVWCGGFWQMLLQHISCVIGTFSFHNFTISLEGSNLNQKKCMWRAWNPLLYCKELLSFKSCCWCFLYLYLYLSIQMNLGIFKMWISFSACFEGCKPPRGRLSCVDGHGQKRFRALDQLDEKTTFKI